MNTFLNKLNELPIPSFNNFQELSRNEVKSYSRNQRDVFYDELKRGVAMLNTHEQMCQYLYSFGNMHQSKLLDAFARIPNEIFDKPLHIIDWGCGQAMGTVNFLDFLISKSKLTNVENITLIEPSNASIKRGQLFVEKYLKNGGDFNLKTINNYFENILSEEIKTNKGETVIHIFSNILDVVEIDLKKLANLIDQNVVSDNFLVCVGPLNPNNRRIDAFLDYFQRDLIKETYAFEDRFYKDKWTNKTRIYKLEANEKGHLIPIEYYPPVQFLCGYELDIVKNNRKISGEKIGYELTNFEVAAPFDLGASIYEDVHPILAVLNNIVCRGLPTKSSVFIEKAFEKAFSKTEYAEEYGEIKFNARENFNISVESLCEKYFNNKLEVENDDLINLQLIFSPLAISRFHKVIIEALITGHLDIKSAHWEILVEELDIPFAVLAMQDFKNLFNNICQLSSDFADLQLPQYNLTVINKTQFAASPLHQGSNVLKNNMDGVKDKTYHMVLTLSMLDNKIDQIENFSEYQVYNNCYFNIKSAGTNRSKRLIYTSSLIEYRNIVSKDNSGEFTENSERVDNLTYFLQLLFRKKSFRPGQLPILDRALQNKPVIGLLPTGGGKSLTYQIAALLQPGVTMIIDPLKSLMKDQFDGLISSGIDSAAYINSTQSAGEKAIIEKQLESSELNFIFLSPERLSIATFRERLRHMHDYSVYFSYGVIDEVHCVSEWGHDFRFSYLHLGRNLYNYVRSKDKEISLFGLTATASFDVLADVERELSGNGAFELDSDVVVRFENTNRLELQYKIEKVSLQFDLDQRFDTKNLIDPSLPRAIDVNYGGKWKAYDCKGAYLQNYLTKVPAYVNEIQSTDNINSIKNAFAERQNNTFGQEQNLEVDIDHNYFVEKSNYKDAGIVFCPHVDNTGVSVNKNAYNLKTANIVDTASFSGKDNDEDAMRNLDIFRENKSPLMVATKAFGMGIDKPNVRFTVNMNYSSSLESFVQEAGRAGRDRRMALASILVSDYSLVTLSQQCNIIAFPIGLLKGKWFYEGDLQKILKFYQLEVPEEFIIKANPTNDIVKLHCHKDNNMFESGTCGPSCTEFTRCDLKKVKADSKGWMPEVELVESIQNQNLKISKKHFNYLNPDYETIMFFFNNNFKGDHIEKRFMNDLLSHSQISIEGDDQIYNGFLSSLLKSALDQSIVVFVPYNDQDSADIQKAIYRMCCIELIEDFTQNYDSKKFRIVTKRKEEGEYLKGLERFLLRYYTADRAALEIEKAREIDVKSDVNPLKKEIYQCLAYLTTFVYDKISEKRKRAIDDMRTFCIEGADENTHWITRNEILKDFLYYYFNSKYAKPDYKSDNGEAFSLVEDTDRGKVSSEEIVWKYLRVIDDDLVGTGTPLDNVRHLYGAVRLISRSLTDSNPALYLLESFCLLYLGTKANESLINQFYIRYKQGMIEASRRAELQKDFWQLFEKYNKFVEKFNTEVDFEKLEMDVFLQVHNAQLNLIKNQYITDEYNPNK
ncbi:ATP-dependent DNA helicase RecQ [Chryseobacterium arthrosphaerae]|uniref:DEAD/DEAH box helicase n=1 Tax=Chryseobacterium arthrosphaerae TaxID=651561 RepID=UPI001E473BC8|nr:DEAD/DEAH box helicase [Chryseobacterium arthrosphaerae]UEQ78057.1 ATP-dependent DNA helicase RecQ [Chryseobacterium arthrosphaerae]